MFDNLIESKAKKQKRAGGTLVSTVIHAAVISAAVYATAHASGARQAEGGEGGVRHSQEGRAASAEGERSRPRRTWS